MRHGNSRIGWPSDSRSDPWHNFKLDSRIRDRLCFLCASTKDKGITALQADNLFSSARFFNQQRVDFRLTWRGFAWLLAGISNLRIITRPTEHFRVCQVIVHDYIGALDAFLCSQCSQAGVARPRANQINLPTLALVFIRH